MSKLSEKMNQFIGVSEESELTNTINPRFAVGDIVTYDIYDINEEDGKLLASIPKCVVDEVESVTEIEDGREETFIEYVLRLPNDCVVAGVIEDDLSN